MTPDFFFFSPSLFSYVLDDQDKNTEKQYMRYLRFVSYR